MSAFGGSGHPVRPVECLLDGATSGVSVTCRNQWPPGRAGSVHHDQRHHGDIIMSNESFMNNVPDPLLAGDDLPTFKFALEKSEGKVIGGSYGKEVTVKQLPNEPACVHRGV
jgi:hypothetical protein